MKFATLTILVTLACAIITTITFASPEKGLEIVIEADSRDKGFGDSTAQIIMILWTNMANQLNVLSVIERLKVITKVTSLW